MPLSPEVSYRVKLVALVVLLPLAVALIGGWQLHRAAGRGWPPVRGEVPLVSISTSSYAGGAVTRIEPGVPEQGAALAVVGLAAGTLILGLAAAGLGAVGLVSIRRSGRQALRSRPVLLDKFRQGLRRLPWLVGALGALLALALVCALAGELVRLLAWGDADADKIGRLVVAGVLFILLLLVYGARLVCNMVRASRAVFADEPSVLLGQSLSRAEAPALWDFVRAVADRVGATSPDVVVAGLDQSFFVTEHPVRLANGKDVPAGRVLYLPLPYLAYLTREEAAAVIGHELGHFTGADTEYSLRFGPIYANAVNHLRAAAGAAEDNEGMLGWVAAPARLLGEYYLRAFHRAVRHWSRERELAADRMGSAAGGGEAVASSLLRIIALEPLVDRALAECWAVGGQQTGGVMARLRELIAEQGLVDPAACLEEVQPHPTDTHPSARQRLEAVGVALTPALLARARDPRESGLLRQLGMEAGEAEAEERDAVLAAEAPGAALEHEFFRTADEQREARLRHLHELAGQGLEERVYYESTTVFALLSLMVGVALLGVAAAVRDLLLVWPCVAVGLVMVGMGAWLGRRRRRPLATLTATGLRVGDMQREGAAAEIPWSAVEGVGIGVEGYSNNVVCVRLAEDYEPPAFRSDRRVRWRPERHMLTLLAVGFRQGVDVRTFARDVVDHWQGGTARCLLASEDPAGEAAGLSEEFLQTEEVRAALPANYA